MPAFTRFQAKSILPQGSQTHHTNLGGFIIPSSPERISALTTFLANPSLPDRGDAQPLRMCKEFDGIRDVTFKLIENLPNITECLTRPKDIMDDLFFVHCLTMRILRMDICAHIISVEDAVRLTESIARIFPIFDIRNSNLVKNIIRKMIEFSQNVS